VGGSSIAESEMNKIEARFATKPVFWKAGANLNWIDYHYKGFPLIATVTNLSQLQADIKTTESDYENVPKWFSRQQHLLQLINLL
jgi:hypothetical protein